MSSSRPRAEHCVGRSFGRVVQTLFGLLFCVPAVVILVALSRNAVQMRTVRATWVPTPCVILDAKVRDADNGDYALSVRYRYEFLGASHVSMRYSPAHEEHRFDSISERDALLSTYGKDASATCLVNPSAPEEAVLVASTDREETPVFIYLFPLAFIVVGLLVAISPWWSPRRRHRGAGPGAPAIGSGVNASESKFPAPLLATLLPIAFCSVFIAVGCGIMTFGVHQRAQMRAAREWPLAEGVVERTEVKRKWQSGSKGHHGHWVFSPYVAYAYEVDGVRRVNDRFGIIESSSSKAAAAQRFVEEHPVGSPIGVRYNPANPTDSVLDMSDAPKRSFVDEWMLTAVGAVFALFGAGFLLIISMEWRRGRAPTMPGGTLRRSGRGAEFVQMLVFSVLWCLVTAALCAGFFSDINWPPKGEDWIPVVFLSVFACIGVGLLVRTLVKGLRMGGPHLEIRCPRGFVARGGETNFTYRLVGRVEDVEFVIVWLVGERVVTERHRDQTHFETHETHEAYRAEVLRAATPHEIGQGFFRVELPDDAPVSDQDDDETVQWKLAVSGHCRNRPGFSDTYRIEVR